MQCRAAAELPRAGVVAVVVGGVVVGSAVAAALEVVEGVRAAAGYGAPVAGEGGGVPGEGRGGEREKAVLAADFALGPV